MVARHSEELGHLAGSEGAVLYPILPQKDSPSE